MGRRNGGGRRSSLQETLRRRVESCMSVDEIVNRLRSTYPDCQRMKLQVLTRFVHDHLQSRAATTSANHQRPKDATPNQEEEQQEPPTITASPRKRRRTMTDERRSRSSSSSGNWIQGSSSSTASLSSSTEEEDSAAIYGDEKSPEPLVFDDLMKTMLRKSYNNNNTDDKKKTKKKQKKKNAAESEAEAGNSSKAAATNSEGVVENHVEEDVKKKGPRFRDLGGMRDVLEELMRYVIVPLCHRPHWLRHAGGSLPSAGLLLHGPPGCGKTHLAHAIAHEAGLPFYPISATQVVSGVSGASEENIRELFSKAYRTAPSIIFIDEIDAIGSKRDNSQRQMENRIVTQLLTCMSQSQSSSAADAPPVLVIGATNRPDALDPALRRSGRFDCEIAVGIPNESARQDILSVIVRTRNMKLEGSSIDIRQIARSTPGFVAADLAALAHRAAIEAVNRVNDEKKRELSEDGTKELSENWYEEMELTEEIKDKLAIKMSDFEKAIKKMQPSLKREGFSTIPDVKWEDVGGLDSLREKFERYTVNPIKDPESYERLEATLETGFLLHGPPGCGKTLIAKALAHEAGANFIYVKGPELLSKFVGESELAVRTLFNRARSCAPCIIFFDEVDALTTAHDGESGSVVQKVTAQLLLELDGAERRRRVFVVGATNRPEVLSDALLRNGRFGKKIYVPLPTAEGRVLILKALARKMPLDSSVDLSAIARMEGYENLSGADLAALMHEAVIVAAEEKSSTIKTRHLDIALSRATSEATESHMSTIVSKNQDHPSVSIALADLHKLRVVVEDADFYGRCCELMMHKNAREVFCTIPDKDHKIIFLKRMAYRD